MMRSFVSSYFKDSAQIEGISDPFHEILFVDKSSRFDELKQKAPLLLKNWIDLLQFSPKEKIEFVLNFWLEILPFAPEYHEAIIDFFGSLDDIGLILIKEFKKDSYIPELIYSFKEKDLFFRGQPPCDEKKVAEGFEGLPLDYLTFFKIHNGFRRFDDIGLVKGENLLINALKFQQNYLLAIDDIPSYQKVYNPHCIVPFYEDKGGVMCFNFAPFPDDIGDICYFSNDYSVKKEITFASFLDWLCYYLEQT